MYNVPSMNPYQNQFYNYVNVPFNNYERQQNVIKDFGAEPFVVNINDATKQNKTFRSALWTGNRLQVTLMSLNIGEDIGLEMHPNVDQFLRVEQGQGIVQMGKSNDNFDFKTNVYDDFAIIIPAGTWHNLTNTGNTPLKLYSIYAPPNHPFGTVHVTKADAIAAEEANRHYKRPENTTNFTNSKNNYTKEEAAAIALLLGIDFTKSKFSLSEFLMGVNTELEHGRKYSKTNVTDDDPLTTGKIALAHLNEFPDYYRRLKVLEEEAKAYWNK